MLVCSAFVKMHVSVCSVKNNFVWTVDIYIVLESSALTGKN